jgi:hypothetical protein
MINADEKQTPTEHKSAKSLIARRRSATPRSSANRTVSKCADLNKPETAMASFAGLVRLAALR